MKHRKIVLMLLMFALKVHCLTGQSGSGVIRIMFYNVENAFDTSDDPATNDNEFLPDGLRRWNQSRYRKKVGSIYKTIIAAGDWQPPEIVALCEIENRQVLEDLVFGTYLEKYNYKIVHEDSPDRRGIDVCLIYRKDAVKIISYRYLVPDSLPDPFFSRSVLYVKAATDLDTFHLFVNHWPSRKGGVLASEDLRLSIAEMVKASIDSLEDSTKGKAKIIITGDFNSTPDDPEIMKLLTSGNRHFALVNFSGKNLSDEGTYKYQGTWEQIDQMIVSDNFFKRDFLYVKKESFKVFKPDFLLIDDPKYPGKMPFATFRGYKYQGGFSDHLPVILTLFRKPDRQE